MSVLERVTGYPARDCQLGVECDATDNDVRIVLSCCECLGTVAVHKCGKSRRIDSGVSAKVAQAAFGHKKQLGDLRPFPVRELGSLERDFLPIDLLGRDYSAMIRRELFNIGLMSNDSDDRVGTVLIVAENEEYDVGSHALCEQLSTCEEPIHAPQASRRIFWYTRA